MSSDALDPELTLKATPPRTPRHLIARARLALGHPRWHDKRMLMLQAPAGYGKTALLLQWRREALQQGALFLWLTLDRRDEPDRFVRGLQTALTLSGGAALGSRVPELQGQEALAMVRLTEWLAQVSLLSSQVLLVLDEIHQAPRAAAAQYLRYMVLNAPANLTIVLASQTVLAAAAPHSVADGQFGVIGTQDLLLDREEAMQVLRSHLGERIDAGMGLRVHDITGGWPLGVQILANAAKHSPDPQRELDRVHPGLKGLEAYLRRFVLGEMEAQDVDFLVRISVATKFTPDLCKAITGRADSAQILERLCENTPLFDELLSDGWMRLHTLARDLLRRRCEKELPPEMRIGLHKRAAEWLAAHGMPQHAARHAIAASMRAWGYDLVEQGLPAILGSGDFDRALEWVDAMPDGELKRRPFAALVAASALSYRAGRSAQRELLVQATLEHAAEGSSLHREAAAVMLQAALSHDDCARSEQLVARWQSEFGQGCPVLDLQLTAARSLACTYRGETAQARQLWQELDLPSDRAVATVARYFQDAAVAYTYLWEARPAQAAGTILPTLNELEAGFGRRSLLATACAALLAAAKWDQGESSDAAHLLLDRIDVLERMQTFRPVYLGFIVAARAAAAQGDEARALGLLERLCFLGELHRIPRYAIESLAEQIRMHAQRHRRQTCSALLASLERWCVRPDVQACGYSEDHRQVLLAVSRSYTDVAGGDHKEALTHIEPGLAVATRIRLGRQQLQLQLLRALSLRRTGDPGAQAEAREAASLAATYGLAGIVGDVHPDLQELLEGQAPHPATVEPAPMPLHGAAASPAGTVIESSLLTPREREVLQCLAAGSPNKRIASSLSISDETVKWHVKNLLNKLGGANRRHVVDRARQMGVIV
jgi:LuxR family transcriptional regulator, maltose regulon positive regulatory protein